MGAGLTLHLGVLIQQYRSSGKRARSMTTGDVAQILEDKYGILGAYSQAHGQDIADAMANSMQGALEAKIMGAPTIDPFGAATQKIQQGMQNFINSREVERAGIAGVPTAAALAGVNHRLRHPYAKNNPRRPSFRDTGLMVGSYRAWVD